MDDQGFVQMTNQQSPKEARQMDLMARRAMIKCNHCTQFQKLLSKSTSSTIAQNLEKFFKSNGNKLYPKDENQKGSSTMFVQPCFDPKKAITCSTYHGTIIVHLEENTPRDAVEYWQAAVKTGFFNFNVGVSELLRILVEQVEHLVPRELFRDAVELGNFELNRPSQDCCGLGTLSNNEVWTPIFLLCMMLNKSALPLQNTSADKLTKNEKRLRDVVKSILRQAAESAKTMEDFQQYLTFNVVKIDGCWCFPALHFIDGRDSLVFFLEELGCNPTPQIQLKFNEASMGSVDLIQLQPMIFHQNNPELIKVLVDSAVSRQWDSGMDKYQEFLESTSDIPPNPFRILINGGGNPSFCQLFLRSLLFQVLYKGGYGSIQNLLGPEGWPQLLFADQKWPCPTLLLTSIFDSVNGDSISVPGDRRGSRLVSYLRDNFEDDCKPLIAKAESMHRMYSRLLGRLALLSNSRLLELLEELDFGVKYTFDDLNQEAWKFGGAAVLGQFLSQQLDTPDLGYGYQPVELLADLDLLHSCFESAKECFETFKVKFLEMNPSREALLKRWQNPLSSLKPKKAKALCEAYDVFLNSHVAKSAGSPEVDLAFMLSAIYSPKNSETVLQHIAICVSFDSLMISDIIDAEDRKDVMLRWLLFCESILVGFSARSLLLSITSSNVLPSIPFEKKNEVFANVKTLLKLLLCDFNLHRKEDKPYPWCMREGTPPWNSPLCQDLANACPRTVELHYYLHRVLYFRSQDMDFISNPLIPTEMESAILTKVYALYLLQNHIVQRPKSVECRLAERLSSESSSWRNAPLKFTKALAALAVSGKTEAARELHIIQKLNTVQKSTRDGDGTRDGGGVESREDDAPEVSGLVEFLREKNLLEGPLKLYKPVKRK